MAQNASLLIEETLGVLNPVLSGKGATRLVTILKSPSGPPAFPS